MDSKSLQEHARRVALERPFTEHCWPFGPEYDVFKVGGKIFMLMATAHGRAHVSLRSGKIAAQSADLPWRGARLPSE